MHRSSLVAVSFGAIATVIAGAVAVYALQGAGPGRGPGGDRTLTLGRVSVPLDATVLVPAGATIEVRLGSALSTMDTRAGDGFLAVVTAPLTVGGRVAVPAGAEVGGHVVRVEPPTTVYGRGLLQLSFDRLSFGGRSYDLDSRGNTYWSATDPQKDAAVVGSGAGAGRTVGDVRGGSAADAAKGAALGAALDRDGSQQTRGPQLTLEAGKILRFRLDQEIRVRRPSSV
jgi:hypothetical protein